ncbi:hypothetical protein LT493_39100 [Streptomyces tricolor]|nr:hypothetical protein [Streptomyces tricolor]
MRVLGTGIGWRPEIADAVERMRGIDWVEVVAENVCPGHLPRVAAAAARARCDGDPARRLPRPRRRGPPRRGGG